MNQRFAYNTKIHRMNVYDFLLFCVGVVYKAYMETSRAKTPTLILKHIVMALFTQRNSSSMNRNFRHILSVKELYLDFNVIFQWIN